MLSIPGVNNLMRLLPFRENKSIQFQKLTDTPDSRYYVFLRESNFIFYIINTLYESYMEIFKLTKQNHDSCPINMLNREKTLLANAL